MYDSIFSPSFGNRPTQLVGRERTLDRLETGLHARPGSRERASLILGQRGSGKTVLLLEMGDRARAEGYAVCTPTTTSNDMPERIIEKLAVERDRLLGPQHPTLAEAGLSVLGVSASLRMPQAQTGVSFQGRLTALVGELNANDIPVIILVDEVQANSEPIRQLVIAYQELVGEGANITLGMAGLPGAISATLNDHVLTFLNRSTRIRLGAISTGDVDAYFGQSFDALGVQADASLRARAAQSTQGSPYMLQLVGHYIVLGATEGKPVTSDLVDEAIELAKTDFETDVCDTTLRALSDVDIDFLNAMTADGEKSRTSDVANRLDVSVDYAQKYRRRLIDSGVVEAAGRGYVRFAVPYLADHLRKING